MSTRPTRQPVLIHPSGHPIVPRVGESVKAANSDDDMDIPVDVCLDLSDEKLWSEERERKSANRQQEAKVW